MSIYCKYCGQKLWVDKDCQSCKSQIETEYAGKINTLMCENADLLIRQKLTQQETAQKIFEDIEKLIIKDHFGNDVIYINVIQWQELKSKYGVINDG